MSWQIRTGDALELLRAMPDASVHCCVTSPPYWGLRDYGVDGQIGLEASFGEYLDRLVEVFDEVHRVLREDGTLWLNMGDSYVAAPKGPNSDASSNLTPSGVRHQREKTPSRGARNQRLANGRGDQPAVHRSKLTDAPRPHARVHGLKPKDLIGQPWRLAFARTTNGPRSVERRHLENGTAGFEQRLERRSTTTGWAAGCRCASGLLRPCMVLDPFAGAGTTVLVADRMGRDAIGLELNAEYAAMARRRISREAPLFAPAETPAGQ